MKIVKKFTAIQISDSNNDDTIVPKLKYAHKSYLYDYVETTFDTEEDAIKWAYETDEYAQWLIIPKISFNNF